MYNWIYYKNLKLKYISFEPSPREYKCITLNCKNQQNKNFALSNKNGNLNFYLKPDTGDSSIIEPAEGYIDIIKVPSITLNQFVFEQKIENIKFLKIEGEGYEPEILERSK